MFRFYGQEIIEYLEDRLKFKVKGDNDYKILGVWQNPEVMQENMIKKINITKCSLKLVEKLDKNMDKYRMLKSVLSLDGFILFYQNMPEVPVYNGVRDKYVYTKNTMWLNELDKVMRNIINISTGISWSDEEAKLLGLSSHSGGISMRSLNTILAPEFLSGIHRSIKSIYHDLDERIIAAANNGIQEKVDMMLTYYNNNTQKKDNINKQEVMHGLDFPEYCRYSMNDDVKNKKVMEDIKECLIEQGIRWNEDDIQEMDEKESIDIKESVIGYLRCFKDEFVLKSMKNNMDKYIYYGIYNKANCKEKARMHANRSKKAMAFLNIPIGRININEHRLDNKEFITILKVRYGKTLKLLDEGARCPKCNKMVDNINEHVLRCNNGFNSGSIHDAVTEYYSDFINEIYGGVVLEPRVENADGSKKRPDAVMHNRIKWMNGEMERMIFDTTTSDIYSKGNLDMIKKGENKIFCAGDIGIKRKETLYADTRCSELMNMGYIFTPIVVEALGGVCKVFRYIINEAIKFKAFEQEKKHKISVWINNWWIKFSVFYNKLLYKRIIQHIPM